MPALPNNRNRNDRNDNKVILEEDTESKEENEVDNHIEKMRAAMSYYETENSKLKNEINIDKIILKANAAKILEQEKSIRLGAKRMEAMEKTGKYEKIANEGLSKKVGNLTQEIIGKNDERKTLIEEQTFNRKKVIDLEQFLSTSRALRLKEIHENEILKIEIKKLRDDSVKDEKENIVIKQNVIDKIIKIENVNSVNTNLNYTVKSQVEEIISLSKEVIVIREKNNSLLDHVRKLEEVLTVYANENDHLKREVEKGRKSKFILKNKNDELISQFSRKTKSDNAIQAYNNTHNNNNNNYNNTNNTTTNNNSFSSDYHPSHSYSDTGGGPGGTSSTGGMGGVGGVSARSISPSATSYRGTQNHIPDRNQNQIPGFSSSFSSSYPASSFPSSSSFSPSFSPSMSDPGHNIHGYDDTNNTHRMNNMNNKETRESTSQPQYNSSHPSHPSSRPHPFPSLRKKKREKKENKNDPRPDAFSSHRSLFVGVGLGLKKENMPEFNPQGSAKSVLKKIMKNFEYEEEEL